MPDSSCPRRRSPRCIGGHERATMSKTSANLTYIAPVFRVTDLSRSLAFYRDQLGFTVEFVYEGFYAGVCRDNCRIHLKCAAHSAAPQAGVKRDEAIDVCIGVQSAESLSASFAAI